MSIMNQTERLAHESARRVHRTLYAWCHRTTEASPPTDQRATASYQDLIAEIRALAAWLLRDDSRDLAELAAMLQPDPLIVPVPGGRILLEFRMLRDLITLAEGCWEPSTMTLMQNLLNPGQTVIDAGAHIWHFTVLAAGAVGPRGRVFAFEPAPDNAARLRRNLALNRFECPVEVIERALSDRSAEVSLYDDGDTFGAEHSLLAQGDRQAAFTATCVTFDAFARQRRLEQVDLIKIDVEGAELKVLEGMRRTLETYPRLRLIIELHPGLVPPSRVCDLLARHGFGLYDADCELEPVAADNADHRFDRTATILATRG